MSEPATLMWPTVEPRVCPRDWRCPMSMAAERNAGGSGRRTVRVVPRMIIRNPFLLLALMALLWRHGVPMISSEFAEGVLGVVWTSALFVLRPFALVATWVDPHFRRFPEFVDVVGTLVLGLLPYVAGDAVYRRLIFPGNPGA